MRSQRGEEIPGKRNQGRRSWRIQWLLIGIQQHDFEKVQTIGHHASSIAARSPGRHDQCALSGQAPSPTGRNTSRLWNLRYSRQSQAGLTSPSASPRLADTMYSLSRCIILQSAAKPDLGYLKSTPDIGTHYRRHPPTLLSVNGYPASEDRASGDDAPEATRPKMAAALVDVQLLGRQYSVLF